MVNLTVLDMVTFNGQVVIFCGHQLSVRSNGGGGGDCWTDKTRFVNSVSTVNSDTFLTAVKIMYINCIIRAFYASPVFLTNVSLVHDP